MSLKLDNPRAFDRLADDELRLSGQSPVPVSVIETGAFSLGGAIQMQQQGEHFYVRAEQRLVRRPIVVGSTLTFRDHGSALAKQIDAEGDFWVIACTAHARRST